MEINLPLEKTPFYQYFIHEGARVGHDVIHVMGIKMIFFQPNEGFYLG